MKKLAKVVLSALLSISLLTPTLGVNAEPAVIEPPTAESSSGGIGDTGAYGMTDPPVYTEDGYMAKQVEVTQNISELYKGKNYTWCENGEYCPELSGKIYGTHEYPNNASRYASLAKWRVIVRERGNPSNAVGDSIEGQVNFDNYDVKPLEGDEIEKKNMGNNTGYALMPADIFIISDWNFTLDPIKPVFTVKDGEKEATADEDAVLSKLRQADHLREVFACKGADGKLLEDKSDCATTDSWGIYEVEDQNYILLARLIEEMGGMFKFSQGVAVRTKPSEVHGTMEYEMSPYPSLNMTQDDSSRKVTFNAAAYGYKSRYVRVDIQKFGDTSKTYNALYNWVERSPATWNGSEFVEGSNVEFKTNFDESYEDIGNYLGYGDLTATLQDGFGRISTINFHIDPPDVPGVNNEKKCFPPTSVGTRQTKYYTYREKDSGYAAGQQGFTFGDVIRNVTGKFTSYNTNGFTASGTQDALIVRNNTKITNTNESFETMAMNIGPIYCKDGGYVDRKGNKTPEVTRTTPGFPKDNYGNQQPKAYTDFTVEAVDSHLKVDDLARNKYAGLNANPKFVHDTLVSKNYSEFYSSGAYAPSIAFGSLQDTALANYLSTTQKGAFLGYNGNSYLRTDIVADLAGAGKVESPISVPWYDDTNGKVDSSPYYSKPYNCTNFGCSYLNYYYKRFYFESDRSHYKQPYKEITYTASNWPEITRFYQNENGDLVLQFTAEGFNHAGVKADLLLNFEGNKDKLTGNLQNLDNPSNPTGGYWRKLVFPEFANGIPAQYKDGGAQSFIYSVGSAERNGGGKQSLSAIDLNANGVTKDTANNRIIIPQAKLNEMLNINAQLDLFEQRSNYDNAGGANKYNLSKFFTYDPTYTDGKRSVSKQPLNITLYLTDDYGRFDHLTINYMPTLKIDGTTAADFAVFQGNNSNSGPLTYTHSSPDGKKTDLTFGQNFALQLDLTAPNRLGGYPIGRPSALAVWENDNPSIRYANETSLSVGNYRGRFMPVIFRQDSSLFGNNGGIKALSGLKLPADNQNFKVFDPHNFGKAGTYEVITPNGSTFYSEFPQVIRAGRGVYYENTLKVSAIIEGNTAGDNLNKLADTLADVFENNSFKLSGQKDGSLLASNREYRNLNTFKSGEDNGGTSANFNKAYGTADIKLSGGGATRDAIYNAIVNSGTYDVEIDAVKDAYGSVKQTRSYYKLSLPIELAAATGKFGGANATSKDLQVEGRNLKMFTIHPNTQDGVYSLRAQGTANLNKLNSGLGGSLNFYSALNPILVYKSIFDNYEEDSGGTIVNPVVNENGKITVPTAPGNKGGGGGTVEIPSDSLDFNFE